MFKLKTIISTGTALAGILPAFVAQPAVAQEDSGEIVVTASRRSEDVTKVPYNISVVGGQELDRRGVANFEDLTRQIPNLNVNSAGARSLNAQRPVMRGLNASSTNRQGAANEQAPVATYLGNVPFGNLFAVDDVERVEVLRGPQGTLYGAGALGGAVRILPNEPELGKFTGSVAGSLGGLSHSSKVDWSVGGLINIPLGDNLAFRASFKHQYDAGFINKYGVFARDGGPYSPPTLANPADPFSSPVLRRYNDSNYTKTDSARASLKWEPSDRLKMTAAYTFARFSGQGGPEDNPHYAGGTDPLDPNTTYPALGKYDVIIRELEPYHRESHQASLDVSYDAGFATLSSTSSYTRSTGISSNDVAYLYLSLPSSYQDYYVGNPRNPRFNGYQIYNEGLEVYTQELRIVSKSGGPIDYTAGGYFQREIHNDLLSLAFPGQAEFAAATGQFFATGPTGESVLLVGHDKFTDKALFGELTWHITPQWQVTGGARIFWQDFERSLAINFYTFGIPQLITANSSTINGKAIFKANTSYEYIPGHNVYATFSQGFRRGGANAFATVGTVAESSSALNYKSDTVDNYEIGFKGHAGGLRYTAAFFWDEWKNPQIGLLTPVNNYPVVVNGSKARSRGFEVEVSGKFTRELSFNVSYAYSDAKLLEGFCIPTGTAVPDPSTGNAILEPCGIRGDKNGRLPGSSRDSANLGLLYSRTLGGDDQIDVDLNAQYNGSVLTSLPLVNLPNPPLLSSYWITNAQVSYTHGPWQLSIYGRNLLDERGVLARNLRDSAVLGTLDDIESVTRPRQFGMTIGYKW